MIHKTFWKAMSFETIIDIDLYIRYT